jgi:hypothetical protein
MNEAKQIYIEYLLLCVRLEDWHGVSDAANDLRVLEAKQQKETPAQGGGKGRTDGDR